MTSHVNKVHHVTTITQVAKDLGEDEDWLRDISMKWRFRSSSIKNSTVPAFTYPISESVRDRIPPIWLRNSGVIRTEGDSSSSF